MHGLPPIFTNPLDGFADRMNDVCFDPQQPLRTQTKMTDDEFWLHDLKVEVVGSDRPMVCNHPEGSYFTVEGENVIFGPGGSFPIYPLAALLPFLPARQRETSANDWMTTDTDIACPDPHCGGRFRIIRTGRRRFRHSETTGLPGQRGTPYWADAQEAGDGSDD